MSARILNLSAYAFVTLTQLAERRATLHQQAVGCGVKGTVLLAQEGINLFVAGAEHGVRRWLAQVRTTPGLQALEAKESWSDHLPFRHLRVKIRQEIIRMNQPAVCPAKGRAPAVDAATLAHWLDHGHDDGGREVRLLDTRNAFEVDAGAFYGTLDWRLSKFSDFSAALVTRRAELEGCTVVAYCTGGIRCEKAALALQAAGLDHVYQLDGGILRYFEQLPAAPHWHGRCFVFDDRKSLGPDLAPPAASITPNRGE